MSREDEEQIKYLDEWKKKQEDKKYNMIMFRYHIKTAFHYLGMFFNINGSR